MLLLAGTCRPQRHTRKTRDAAWASFDFVSYSNFSTAEQPMHVYACDDTATACAAALTVHKPHVSPWQIIHAHPLAAQLRSLVAPSIQFDSIRIRHCGDRDSVVPVCWNPVCAGACPSFSTKRRQSLVCLGVPPAHLKAISLWMRSSATSTMLGRSVCTASCRTCSEIECWAHKT